MERIRIFISSPGDVSDERRRALTVVERLQGEFRGRLSLEPLLWEQEPLLATADFQSQIRSPADFDIFVNIIGGRLGSPLGSQFTRRDGSPYASGTEFEFEVAVASHLANGRPELLFYRKEPPAAQPEGSQLEKVAAFFDRWFPDGGDGTGIGDYHTFADTEQFEERFTHDLRRLLHRLLPRPNNLPAPIDNFVGRAGLVGEISRHLRQDETRIVNLTGPGGIGKSRLGVRVARGLLSDFRDGVFLVNLSSSGEGRPLAGSIAGVLEVRREDERCDMDTLLGALRDSEMLLLLDDFEQDGQALRDLESLVAGCPGVKFLLTGREAVPLSTALNIAVPPLVLPDSDGATFSDIRDSECVQFFVERAQAVREDFELTEENAQDILEICRQLEARPLSVELAASRMRTMNASKMLRSLASIKVKDESGKTVYLIPR